jgi:hypothetical protein
MSTKILSFCPMQIHRSIFPKTILPKLPPTLWSPCFFHPKEKLSTHPFPLTRTIKFLPLQWQTLPLTNVVENSHTPLACSRNFFPPVPFQSIHPIRRHFSPPSTILLQQPPWMPAAISYIPYSTHTKEKYPCIPCNSNERRKQRRLPQIDLEPKHSPVFTLNPSTYLRITDYLIHTIQHILGFLHLWTNIMA